MNCCPIGAGRAEARPRPAESAVRPGRAPATSSGLDSALRRTASVSAGRVRRRLAWVSDGGLPTAGEGKGVQGRSQFRDHGRERGDTSGSERPREPADDGHQRLTPVRSRGQLPPSIVTRTRWPMRSGGWPGSSVMMASSVRTSLNWSGSSRIERRCVYQSDRRVTWPCQVGPVAGEVLHRGRHADGDVAGPFLLHLGPDDARPVRREHHGRLLRVRPQRLALADLHPLHHALDRRPDGAFPQPDLRLAQLRLLGGHRVLRPPHRDRRIFQLQHMQLGLLAARPPLPRLWPGRRRRGVLVAGVLVCSCSAAPPRPPWRGRRRPPACAPPPPASGRRFAPGAAPPVCWPAPAATCASRQVGLGRVDLVHRHLVVHREQRRVLLNRVAVVGEHLDHAARLQRVERRDALFQVGVAEEVVVQVGVRVVAAGADAPARRRGSAAPRP